MNQIVAEAIVLGRTDYGEADRILTLLTPDHGKLRVIAKGVRRVKSKLAGGIELFSVSSITYIEGRGDIGTLISTRLIRHYGRIIQDLDRTMLGYDLIKQLNKVTEDHPESEYFYLLQQAFEALDDAAIPIGLVRFWFVVQLIRMGGHTPNLRTNAAGQKMQSDQRYNFDASSMCFEVRDGGHFDARHIKFLRLGFAPHTPKALSQVQGNTDLTADLSPLLEQLWQTSL